MFEERFIYPLVDEGYTKDMVVAEVRTWPFDLEIEEHEGNCLWCWKKSLRKLLTLAKDHPNYFDFPAEMERDFGNHMVTEATASPVCGRRLFFRGYRTVADLKRMAAQPFEPFTDRFTPTGEDELDYGVGCGESCEIGSDERYGLKPDPLDEIF
jgi:hypothetical protein